MRDNLKSFFTEHCKYMAVSTACKLDLFDHLQDAKTAKQLAEKLSLNEEKLLVLLTTLHNADFLDKKGDYFKVNSLSEFLTDNNPKSLKYACLNWSGEYLTAWLFNRFIPHCDWFECDLLFPECLNHIEIISEESWFQNPRDKIRLSIKLDFNSVPEKTHKLKIDEFVNKSLGQAINEKRLILIGKYIQNTISLIDGNHRFTALYEEYKQNLIENVKIKIIVGFTFGNFRWLGDYEKWEERPSKENEKRYILNIW